ncbi:MAG TPA: hypothetical protein VHL14_10390, partial [Steroidobacteraceae bacterium]|nr:hypothetical protein [Steroidobacteraceae bacterium]
EYDPAVTSSKQLDSNKYVIAAQAAIDGKQPFDTVFDEAAYRSMATVPPPPEVKIVKEPCARPRVVKSTKGKKAAK